jgi:hypothetical protein
MSEDQQLTPKPLNRGGNAMVGFGLLLAIFAGAGPPIGAVAALGPFGFHAALISYSIGIIPAVVAGLVFVALWMLNVDAWPRSIWTVIAGVLACIAMYLPSGGAFAFYMAWAGGVAAVLC